MQRSSMNRCRIASALLMASGASLVWAMPASAQEQAADPTEAAADDEIVVTGIRASIAEALNTKRNASNILDSISAQDIGKLPDQNVSETLSRIPGVQITRVEGEGSKINVRGIDLNRTLLNGKNFIGAATNGDPNLNDFPSEILASVDVIKSPSADLIEGWLGALINLKTRRPLDLREPLIAGRIQGSYGDQAEQLGGKISATFGTKLFDDRVGIMLSGTGSVFNGRTFGLFTRGFTQVTGLTATGPGANAPRLFRPNRIESYDLRYETERYGLNGTIQARPVDELTITFDALHSRADTARTRNVNQILFTNTLTNVVALADGTIDRATVGGVTIRPIIFDGPNVNETSAYALSLNWNKGRWDINLNASRSSGDGDGANDGSSNSASYYAGNDYVVVTRQLAGNTAAVTYDWTTADNPVPDYNISANYDVTSPNQYEGFTTVDQQYPTRNFGRDADFDATYTLDWGWLKSVKVGGRIDEQSLTQRVVGITHDLTRGDPTPANSLRATEIAGLTYAGQSNDYFSGERGAFGRTILVGSFDPIAFRDRFGANRTNADFARELGTVFDVSQDNRAVFAMANFGGDLGGVEFSGNVGVRYVDSRRRSEGFSLTGPTTALPVAEEVNFKNTLPSFNLSVLPASNVTLRAAASKIVARPPLALTGVGIQFNPTAGTGSAGNPLLRPFEATQYDLSAEWYFARASLFSLALFRKDISAFTRTIQQIENRPEVVAPGLTNTLYVISRPVNGTDGRIDGFEANYFHAFTFLPAPFDGLGVNVSYTYSKGTTPNVDELTGETLSLPNLSKHSYNLVGYYEKDGLNLRVAYNYRSAFLVAQQTAALGGSIYQNDFGQLDASASYRIGKNITLTLDGINLTRANRTLFTGTENRLTTSWRDDRRVYFGASFTF
ncbi:TonB-dependent receptor [Sphingomonas sp. CJ99]